MESMALREMLLQHGHQSSAHGVGGGGSRRTGKNLEPADSQAGKSLGPLTWHFRVNWVNIHTWKIGFFISFL